MPLSPELRDTAITGARQARAKVAAVKTVLRTLADTESERQALTDCVGFLYESEIAEGEHLLDSLQLGLGRLSEAMKLLQGSPHAGDAALHQAQADLAMALATLYPSTCTMESLLRPDEPRESLVPAPSKRLTLEVVPDEDERRAEARQRIDTAIGLRSDNFFFTGQAGDISTGGLFVASDDLKPVGTEVTLSFVLPSGYQVTALGVVKWTGDEPPGEAARARTGMGIAFQGLHPSDRAAIDNFLLKRPPFDPAP